MLKRIVVLVSGGGTNLQALIDAQARDELGAGEIVQVISSNPDAYAIKRAEKAGIPCEVIPRSFYKAREDYDAAILAALQRADADLVVLAGFLYILGSEIVSNYTRRIINVHPSLVPAFCGDGYYGIRVHRAALTGATVHFVNEVTDGGQIILQKAVEVLPSDTPETLQRRVMEQAEWELLPRAVALVCNAKSN